MNYSALTFNIWDIPLVRARNNYTRIGRLIERIYQEQPDFVLLQESFRIGTRRRLADSLQDYQCPDNMHRRRFPNVFFDATGGLVTLSRYPIATSEFRRFETSGRFFDEWISGKGYTYSVVETPDGTLVVVNLHLSNHPEDGETREQQLGQVLSHLDERHPVIMGGDFNMRKMNGSGEKTEEYKMLESAEFVDSLVGQEADFATFCRENRYATGDKLFAIDDKNWRLDYVFLRGTQSRRVRPVSSKLLGVRRLISDHYGYLSEFRMEN